MYHTTGHSAAQRVQVESPVGEEGCDGINVLHQNPKLYKQHGEDRQQSAGRNEGDDKDIDVIGGDPNSTGLLPVSMI